VNSHIASGISGGITGASLLYGIYTFTPSGRITSKINKAAREADKKYQQAAAAIKDKASSTDEAIDRLRQFYYSYVVLIPGGRYYVDITFKDFDSIRESYGEDIDKLVNEVYTEFQDITKSGLSVKAVSKIYEALTDLGQKLAKLVASATNKILDNYPQIKEKVGGLID